MIRVAAGQGDVIYGDHRANIAAAGDWLLQAKAAGAQLLVLPEAFLTGYAAPNAEDAVEIALNVFAGDDLVVSKWDEALDDLKSMVDAAGLYLVVGFAGRDQFSLYNGALLMAPNCPSRIYRKTHLPFLGFDRYARPGDRLFVWETDLGKVAPLICFDLRIPEAARTLALMGAEIIVLPTNWPNGASVTPKHIAPTRAAENKVYLITCDRVGRENGFTFIGQSAIYDPFGIELAKAGDATELIVADIDMSITRDKRNILIPGEYEIDPFATRQPGLYAPLQIPPHG